MNYPSARGPSGLFPINEMIERSEQLYGRNIALRKRTSSGWLEYTYSQLLSRVKRIAHYLRKTGHEKGIFIGIAGDNGPEWIIAFLAIQWIGAVAIPIDSRAKETEVSQIICHSGLRTVFASTRVMGLLKGMIQSGELKRETLLIPMDEMEGGNALFEESTDLTDDGVKERVSIEDLAILQYTSGTTGNPKGVMLSHRNISSNISSLYQAVVFDQKDRFFSVLPIHHVYEGTAGNWLPLSVGASITYSRSLKSKEMIEDARDTEPTVMLAVPLLLEKMLVGIQRRLDDLPRSSQFVITFLKGGAHLFNSIKKEYGSRLLFRTLRRQMGFGRLRFFVSGGAALSPWVQRGLEDFGFVVLQGYGLSETSPVLTLNPLEDRRLGSTGLPIPDVQIRITDPDDQGIGEIAAMGENVMAGYYKNEDASKFAFTSDHFLLTGDMGYRDRDGFLYITGRKKSIIVTPGGENVFPEEIEALMLKSPFIEEILVLRGHNPRTGSEEVQAIIYPNREQLGRHFAKAGTEQPDEEAIRAVIRREIDERSRRLAAYKRIVQFTLRTEEFPKTTTQKIKRYLFEQQDLKPSGP